MERGKDKIFPFSQIFTNILTPLKVLEMLVVVMNKIDYSTYLTGSTKEELDKMDKLAGKYRMQSSKLTIEAIGNDNLWKVSPCCRQMIGSISRRCPLF